MTERCLKNITPDSITGMIMAMEGFQNAVVLLNGPMGCKFYHSTTSQFLTVRPLLYVPSEKSGRNIPVDYNYLNDYFFRQPRVPCTYLDGYDYVYGTRPKVRDALRFLKKTIRFDLLAIVNSPGASLIGDSLKDLAAEELPGTPCVILESPGYSEGFSRGYENALLALLQQAGDRLWSGSPDRSAPEPPAHPCVNILGLSIYDRYAEGDRAELRRIFGAMGVTVSCFPASSCSLDELKRLPGADLNIVITPERGRRTAEYLKNTFGTEFLVLDRPPVGFGATEEMLRSAAERLSLDTSRLQAALDDCARARALAWYHINNIYDTSGRPNGIRYAVEAPCSWLYAFAGFFTEYLGMLPDSLVPDGPADERAEKMLRDFLSEHHCASALSRDILDTDAELVFSNANTIAQLKEEGKIFCGIEISLPSMGYTDIIPKTQIGVRGSLFLTEQVLNGMMSRL